MLLFLQTKTGNAEFWDVFFWEVGWTLPLDLDGLFPRQRTKSLIYPDHHLIQTGPKKTRRKGRRRRRRLKRRYDQHVASSISRSSSSSTFQAFDAKRRLARLARSVLCCTTLCVCVCMCVYGCFPSSSDTPRPIFTPRARQQASRGMRERRAKSEKR